MSDGLTRTESALLDALERERALLQERELLNSIIVHELANSVTAVGTAVDLMGFVPQGSAAYTRALLDVRLGSKTLVQLLAGLRVLMDCTGRPPAVEPMDIIDFVQTLISDPLLVTKPDQSRIRFEVRDGGETWHACPALLRHALGNLLRNALRYGTPGASVRITVGGNSRKRWLHVLNKGHRIPDSLRTQLFTPGRKNPKGGMGLGLYISRSAVMRSGGLLRVGSTDACTVFSIIMPSPQHPFLPIRTDAFAPMREPNLDAQAIVDSDSSPSE